MHEHVAHGISCPVVSGMFKEFFGLRVYTAEIWRFKAMMAKYTDRLTSDCSTRMLSGEVLQIDETEVRLRTGTGYCLGFHDFRGSRVYVPTHERGDFCTTCSRTSTAFWFPTSTAGLRLARMPATKSASSTSCET